MSDDRLRRLDALFAERVLGGKYVPVIVQDDLILKENMEPSIKMHFEIPPYTRSLDAAWEGMVKLAKSGRSDIINFALGYQYYHGDPTCFACFTDVAGSSPSKYPTFNSTKRGDRDADTHPAEALVLACLRAVGCTEEELKCDS